MDCYKGYRIKDLHCNSLTKSTQPVEHHNIMLRILIADDHDIVRQGIRQLLLEEFNSVQVEEAIDTPTLIDLALSQDWDIIVSDLVMPGGGGRVKSYKE